MFANNIVKFSEILNNWNLLKICLKFTFLPISEYFAAILVWEKWKYSNSFQNNE